MTDARPQPRRALHVPPGGRTAADGLRDDLGLCEKWVVALDQAETDPIRLLQSLDRIVSDLEGLEERGVNLQAERVRLENVLNQLRRRGAKLVARAGVDLIARRPDDARWWWYLDQEVAARRLRLIKQAVTIGLAVLLCLVAAYYVYDRFLGPPPNVREAYSRMLEGEQAAAAGDLDEAITHFEAAVAADPQGEEAYLWLGVLYRIRGRAEESEAAFEQARALIEAQGEAGDQVQFYVWRGMVYAKVGDLAAATDDALRAIDLNPQSAEAYFVLGQVAELADDRELAINAYLQAIELAEAAGEVELGATIRIRLATVMQQ